MASIRWLHLTDLHEADQHDASTEARLWPNVKEKFLKDLNRFCPLDIVFFTGDLTYRGAPKDFKALGSTLQALWDKFDEHRCNPVLLAIPGNHDVCRPDRIKLHPQLTALGKWDKDVRDMFWTGTKSPKSYRSVVDAAFSPFTDWYKGWRDKHSDQYRSWTSGMLPGDFSVTVEKDGIRLGVVGLNSAFLQLTGDDYHGRLELDVRQLHKVCSREVETWLKKVHAAVLLTHHPADWLRDEKHFWAEIATPGRFLIHLCGHMHEPAAEYIRIAGSQTVRFAQGASLFGVEQYGEKDKQGITRIHGYSVGELEVKTAEEMGALKIWPRILKSGKGKSGDWLAPDWDNFELNDENAFNEDVPVRFPVDTRIERLLRKCLGMESSRLIDALQQCREIADAHRKEQCPVTEEEVARLRVEVDLLCGHGTVGDDPWTRVQELADLLADEAPGGPEIQVTTCYALTEKEARERIAHYFSVLREDLDVPDRDLSLLCSVRIEEGFLAPVHLLTGLLARFEEDWTPVLTAFGRSVTEGNPPVWRMPQSFIFDCWLLWGPSIPICSCELWTAPPHGGIALQYGYGDENNSIPLFVTANQRDEIAEYLWAIGGSADAKPVSPPQHGLARRVSLMGSLTSVSALEGRLPPAQEAIIKDGKYDYIVEYRRILTPPEPTAGDYYSAYVWVMFEAERRAAGADTEQPWLRLLPFFEHTNIADGGTYDFMRDQLARKALSFVSRYRDTSTTFRYVCAFDDPGHRGQVAVGFNRPTVREKIEDLLKHEYANVRACIDITAEPSPLVACQLPGLVAAFYDHVSATGRAPIPHEPAEGARSQAAGG